MNADIKQLEDLFWQAKNLDPGQQRNAFVEDVESRDADAAKELKRLLADDAKSDQVFGGLSVLDDDSNPCAETSDSVGGPQSKRSGVSVLRAGSTIGPYKLLEPIGEGGMGLVYMAQQSQPVRRKVALKIIKPGMDSAQVVARFEAERQALAMMDHPNIAKVLDAGTTESGLPYFVMELVRGIPITEYCDQAKMPTRRRLELFASVCNAIQHAHNKGVIHRDIKPSNVLVTEQDGEPLVKVIDFGIAKALTDNLTDKTMFTGMFQMMGTPLYMSPEQASLSNVDVDTRSDVYSLGVMLYELLSGCLPIDRDEVKELSFDELRKRICETEPPRPSKRVSTLQDANRETVAERRGLDVKLIHRIVTSELDWIVMQAIEKDRSRRYQSAREISDDITRYLTGDAVAACPPSTLYRLQKFYRKNRVIAAVLGTIMISAISIAAVSAWQMRRAFKAEQTAIDESRNLEGVVEFLVDDLLGSADPARSGGEKLSVVEAMANARATIGNAFPKDSKVGATIRHTMAVAYFRLGEYPDATSIAREAHAIRSELLGEQHEQTLDSLSVLANALAKSGSKECSDLYDQLVSGYSQLKGKADQATLAARMNRALASLGRHGKEDAVQELQSVNSEAERLFGARDTFTLVAKSNLVEGLYLQSRFFEADTLATEILETIAATHQAPSLKVLIVMRNIAKLQTKLARFSDAEANLRTVIRAQRKYLGGKHPQLFRSIRQLAECLYQQYDREKAPELLELYSEWESIATELYGKNSETAWRARYRIIDAEWRLGVNSNQTRESIVQKLDQLLDQPAVNLPLDAGVRFEAMQTKAFVLNDLSRYDEAEQIHRQIVAECMKRYPKDHERILQARYDLSFVLMNGGKASEAEEILREVVAKQQEVLGLDHPMSVNSLKQLGRAIYRQKRYRDAAEIYERVAMIREQSPKYVDKPMDPSVSEKIALCYLVEDQFAEAEKHLRAVIENVESPNSLVFSQGMRNLIVCFLKQDKTRELIDVVSRQFPEDQLQGIKSQFLAYESPNAFKHRRNLGTVLAVAAWEFSLWKEADSESRRLACEYGRAATELWENDLTFNNFGVALYTNDQYSDAIEALQRADSMVEGGDRKHRMFLAMAHFKAGNREEAQKYFEEGIAWQTEQDDLSNEQVRFRRMAEGVLGLETLKNAAEPESIP